MQDSRRREIRIKADSFRVKCKISRYGIIKRFVLIMKELKRELVICSEAWGEMQG